MRSRLFSILALILWGLIIVGCSDELPDKQTDPDNDNMTLVDEPKDDNLADVGNVDDNPTLPFAPNFTLSSTEFEEVSLTDYEGKVVLLDFWATWCKPCEEEIPIFVELYDQYHARGFEIIGVSLDEEGIEVIKPFIEKLGVNYKILLAEPEIVEKYKLTAIPSAFLINRMGRIVKVFDGAQGEKAIYEKALQELL